jgi:hypothetical protein
VVSAEAIIQADATIIVGVMFLLTLREALKLRRVKTLSLFNRIYYPVLCFMISAVAAVIEDSPFADWFHIWLIARAGFTLGILLLAYAMFLFLMDLLREEKEPKT